MRSRFCHYMTLVAAAIIYFGCSATRDLEDGRLMLDKVKVEMVGKQKNISTSQLKNYVRQRGNSRWFLTFKIPLGVYAMAGKDNTWINRTLRSMGEAPVVFDTLMARLSCEDIKLALQNMGYLDADVSMRTEQKGKKVDIVYMLDPKEPYMVSDYQTDIGDSVIARQLAGRTPVILKGRQFNVNDLNMERQQITSFLQDQGYFRFHKEYITYRARKDKASKQVGLTLVLHPYSGHTPLTLRYPSHHLRKWASQRLGNPPAPPRA